MGLTNQRFIVKESRRARRKASVDFLIDSGAVYSLVPAATLRKLGVKPHRTVVFTLADDCFCPQDCLENLKDGDGWQTLNQFLNSLHPQWIRRIPPERPSPW